MAQFQLHFNTGAFGRELVRTVFEHPLARRRIDSTRGKSEGAFSQGGTFQWTPAVRALCILVLRSKIAALEKSPYGPVLQTMARGAVSALDYAISRRAAWISDMFGTDSHGRPIARRVFKRSNPERKRPGPLAIALNQKFLPSETIEILVDGKLLHVREDLLALTSSLIEGSDWDLTVIANSTESIAPSSSAPSLQNFRPSFLHELTSMLRATNIFSPRALRGALRDLEGASALTDVQADICSELDGFDLKLIGSERLGLTLKPNNLHLLFPDGKPLRFGVTPSQIGTLALLRFLRDKRKLPIEIDYSFAHTSDLAKGVETGGGKEFPDCCVMTTASFALLKGSRRREFRPLMVMPAATHSIMGPRTESPHDPFSSACDYLFLSEFPTTPAFWFQTLQHRGVIDSAKSRALHSDPDETLTALKSHDAHLRAILWFPYNVIASTMTDAAPLLQSPALGSGLGFIQNILFVHESLAKSPAKKRLLNVLMRDAWLSLLEEPQERAAVIDAQLEEEDYRRRLWRYSGLYRFEQQSAA